jgi:hypothetical protein
MAKKAADEIIVKVPLEVRLTDAELKTASKNMAEAINKRTRIVDEVETFRAQKKAELTAIAGVIAQNAVLVNSEKEFRLVECRLVYDFSVGKKYTSRLDTGELVCTEQITNEERQQMMPGVVDGTRKAAGE